jgi:site-specific DNA-methyltransferase (adenine-specific)
MPQLSGDRPPQGFEHICCYHPKGKKRWNGPGNLTHFEHKALRGEEKHKCEKPLDQALDLVSYFTEIGESILDPFAGHGTIGVACMLLGRNYVGFERDPEWAEKAQRRIRGHLSNGDVDRILRWLDHNPEPESEPTPKSLLRAQSRALDKENVRRGTYLLAA